MADQVHPYTSPPAAVGGTAKPPAPPSKKLVPQPEGSYVYQIPKDQVYRAPYPRRYERLPRRKPRRSSCCRCLCCIFSFILILAVLFGIANGVLYLVFRPEPLKYSVQSISVSGFNLTTPAAMSPAMNVSVRATNPNSKIGIYYQNNDSDVNVYYTDIKLCDGVVPSFYQPANNVTVFKTALRGADLELSQTERRGLVDARGRGRIPLKLNIRAPVRVKVGSVKTWEIPVKINCDVTVDKLTAGALIVSQDCDYGVDLW